MEQLPHPGAGLPFELLFDGVESGNDCGDPLLDRLLDPAEVEGDVARVELGEDLGLVVLTSDQLEYEHQAAYEDLVLEIATWLESSSLQ